MLKGHFYDSVVSHLKKMELGGGHPLWGVSSKVEAPPPGHDQPRCSQWTVLMAVLEPGLLVVQRVLGRHRHFELGTALSPCNLGEVRVLWSAVLVPINVCAVAFCN